MGLARSTYLDDAIDEAIGEISKERDWSPSKTIANMLKESPQVRERIKARGLDPDTLEPLNTESVSQ